MAYYKLIRCPADGKAVRGMLYRRETYFDPLACIIREKLHPVCPTLENADYLIPALIYRIQVTMSPKFKRLLPLVCQVPGRAGIRVHRGTRPEHSHGCILVSAENEKVLTELWLTEQKKNEETRIEITDYRNGA